MNSPSFLVPLLIGFAASGVLFILVVTVLERRRGRKAVPGSVVVEMPCPNCSRQLVIHKNELAPLSAAEVALVVSATRTEISQPLGEYRCPYCRASHIFAFEGKQPRYLMSDTFESRPPGTHCANCRNPLIRPHWPPGMLDGKLHVAKELQPRHGLVCSRCGAICCVECVKNVTRNRTNDNSLICPRCYRGPVDRVHHFNE